MNDSEQIHRHLSRAQRISFGIGIALLLISLPKAILESARFCQSYLFAYLFWLEITIGSMALLMVYLLTGGGWGAVTRRILVASMHTIYVMALLFVPIGFGASKIYPWADPAKLKLQNFAHKSIYFDFSFFSLRTFFYFISWMVIAYFLGLWLNKKESVLREKAVKVSAGALIYLGISITWAAIDWQMSLDPLWYSTIYGMVFAIGQAFGAWAFTVLIYKILIYFHNDKIFIPPKTELDLGNILLTLVMVWAYVSFMQYLIVWSANLPDEVTWFGKRMHHGWEWILMAIFLFQFAAPFSVLLFRHLKSRKRAMIILTSSILLVRVLDRYWMIMPAFTPEAISVTYIDVTLWAGLGGIWTGLFLWNLNKHSLFALDDPNWPKPEKVLIHA